MWRKFTIYFIIIVFIKMCSCNDFFIVKKYEDEGARYYCITNSSFALSWIIEDTSHSTDLQVSNFLPKYSWDIGDEMRKNKWQYEKTISEEFILDRRWERMKIFEFDNLDNVFEHLKFNSIMNMTLNSDISFSIQIKDYVYILLCDGIDVTNSNCYVIEIFEDVSTIRKCRRGTITKKVVKKPCIKFKTIQFSSSHILNHGSWHHFRLSQIGNTLTLTLLNGASNVSYSDPQHIWNIFDVKYEVKYLRMLSAKYPVLWRSHDSIFHIKNYIGFWKFHEIYYYSTVEEKEMKFKKPIQVIDGSICISMFAKMCERCTIKLEISDRYNLNMTIIFRRKGLGWQEIKFKKVNIYSNEIYLTLTIKNTDDPNPYWKISDIAQCGINNFRIIELNKAADCQLVSHKTEIVSLNESNQIEDSRFIELYTCKETEIGRSCIPCRWFTDNGCNQMKICEKFNQSTQCYCSAGYKIKNGNLCSRCDDGYYGHFCRKKCPEHCINCNNVNGSCSRCTENYIGSKCDIILPVDFKNASSIAELGYTSVTIILNYDLSGNIANADSYISLYKKEQYSTLKYWQKSFELDKTKIIKIANLEPGQNYIIKHVVVEFNKTYEVLTLDLNTKCDAVTEKHFIVRPSNTSSTILLFQEVQQRVCPFRIRSVELTFPPDTKDFLYNYSLSKIILSQLKPFQQYEILIKTNDNEIRKLFKTTEGIPEKVLNLMAIQNDINVNLTWKKPENINGELTHYTVKYKLNKYNGCRNIISECCEKIVNVTHENIILYDLSPFTTMLFSISAANAKFEGIPEKILLNVPASDFIHNDEIPKLQSLKVHTSSVSLQFSAIINCTKMRGPLIIMLNANCSEEWCISKYISVSKEYNSSIHLFGLSVFTNYTLELKFCRVHRKCSPTMETLYFQTYPEFPYSVRNLTVYTKNNNSISLRWMPPFPPTGILEGYNIKYSVNKKNSVSKIITITTCSLWKKFHCFTLTNLSGNQNFYIDIMAMNKIPTKFGPTKSIRTATKKEQPGKPPGLKIIWTLENDLKISWQHPIEANGYIERFDITALTPIPNDRINNNHSLNVTEKDYQPVYLHIIKAKNLFESTKYKIAIRAYNGFNGNESSLETFSPPNIPLFKRAPTFKLSNNTIKIETSEIENLKKTDTYEVLLLIQGHEIDTSTHPEILKRLKMNFDIETSNLRITYRCRYKTIQNLGIENNINECGQNFSAILSGTAQNVSILLVHTDRNQQNSYKFYSFAQDEPKTLINLVSDPIWLALLLLLLLIPVAIVIYKHTPKGNMFGTTSPDMESPEEAVPLTAFSGKADIKNSRIYSNKVPLKQFEQYVKKTIGNGELERQHALLPRGQMKPWECGALQENKFKNRYNSFMAYDHTRVVLTKLKNQEHSDYINANYIDGYKVPKVYIATQGPIESTTCDFWRMIWQENVQHIVMLANVFEAGERKCEKYWPDKNATTSFENISVHFISSQVFADYQHRIFDVICNNERRTVHQYHFFSWPDVGVHLDPQCLVPFLQNLQKITPDSKSPIVVHCSGGVGRTGIIILCDICLRMAAEKRAVDVLRVFQKLRDQRPNMVDSIQQYKLAHLVILEYLIGTKTGENEYHYPLLNFSNNQKYENTISYPFSKKVDLVDFEEYIEKAEISGELNVQHDMVKQYQNNVTYMEVRDNQYFEYIDIEFSKDNILPKVYILADVQKIGSANKFWKTIWEENVRHIIFLASTKEEISEQLFYPNNDEKIKCSSISVQMALNKLVDNYIQKTFILINNEEMRQVNQIEFGYQGQNPSQFVSFLKKMSTFPLSTTSPIFIHSSEIERSSFILLCNMCLRMAEKKQAVDVWKNLKQLSDHRMDMVCRLELYKLAHLVILKTVFWREFEEDIYTRIE